MWFLVPDWLKNHYARLLVNFFLRFSGGTRDFYLLEKKTKYRRKAISYVFKTSRWLQVCFEIVFRREVQGFEYILGALATYRTVRESRGNLEHG